MLKPATSSRITGLTESEKQDQLVISSLQFVFSVTFD